MLLGDRRTRRSGPNRGLAMRSHRSSANWWPWARVTAIVMLALAIIAPSPAVAASAGSDVPRSTHGSPAPADLSINLYEKGGFASQETQYWCIGASMQMMLNIVGVSDEESRASQ